MKIALAFTLTLLLLGCSEENKQEVKKEVATSVEKVKSVTQEETDNIVESVKKASSEALESATSEAVALQNRVIKKSREVVKKSAAALDEALQESAAVDGAKLYKKCSACHGSDASKAALGKSQKIKGWSADKLKNAINGYKDGSYGGAMKSLMKSQVASLSDLETEALAQYISEL